MLGFSHAETAEVLAVSGSAVNSLLSRARETGGEPGAPVPDLTDPRVQQFRERYVRAWQLADIEAFVQLVTEDVRFSMPPLSAWLMAGRRWGGSLTTRSSLPPGRTG